MHVILTGRKVSEIKRGGSTTAEQSEPTISPLYVLFSFVTTHSTTAEQPEPTIPPLYVLLPTIPPLYVLFSFVTAHSTHLEKRQIHCSSCRELTGTGKEPRGRQDQELVRQSVFFTDPLRVTRKLPSKHSRNSLAFTAALGPFAQISPHDADISQRLSFSRLEF